MIHKLSTYKYGSMGVNSLFDIDVEHQIIDICYYKDYGYFFISKYSNTIGHIDIDNDGKIENDFIGNPNENSGCKNGRMEYSSFDSPCAIRYSVFHNGLVILENHGKQIRKVSREIYHATSMIDYTEKENMEKRFVKNKRNYDLCDFEIADSGAMYWVVGAINKGFKSEFCTFDHFFGSGRSGYSHSTNVLSSDFNSPSGICVNGSDIYVADTFNHCIRKIVKKYSDVNVSDVSIVAGNPLISGDKDGIKNDCLLMCPTKMISLKKCCYFIDHHKIKCLSLADNAVNTIYESDDIITISDNGEDKLIIVEVENET